MRECEEMALWRVFDGNGGGLEARGAMARLSASDLHRINVGLCDGIGKGGGGCWALARCAVGLRLWVVVVVVAVSLGLAPVGAQTGGIYANQTLPATVTGNITSFDQTIQQEAYSAFARLNPGTGVNYTASLTGDLANVTVHAVRLRVGSLRRYGVTLGRFIIPAGLRMTNVSSVRVILVYRDFGNVSVYSPSVPGQVLVSSLAGIRVYNGDTLNTTTPLPELSAIDLGVSPFQVIIPPNAQPSYCVEYYENGTVYVSNAIASATNGSATDASSSLPTYACFSRTLGDNDFALVGLPPPGKKSNTWKIIVGTVVGVVGLILLLLLFVFCCRRQLRKRKMAQMQAQVDRGETLPPTPVGSTRAPVATQTRTRPMLERDFNVS